VQKSAAVLCDIKTARARREAYSGCWQQVNSHVPLGRIYEDVFPAAGLQSWWTAVDSSSRLLGECQCSGWFWSCCRNQYKLCVLPLKSDQVTSTDVNISAAICYCPRLCVFITVTSCRLALYICNLPEFPILLLLAWLHDVTNYQIGPTETTWTTLNTWNDPVH